MMVRNAWANAPMSSEGEFARTGESPSLCGIAGSPRPKMTDSIRTPSAKSALTTDSRLSGLASRPSESQITIRLLLS